MYYSGIHGIRFDRDLDASQKEKAPELDSRLLDQIAFQISNPRQEIATSLRSSQ